MNLRPLGLAVVLFLSAAAPTLAAAQDCSDVPLTQHWDGGSWTQVPVAGAADDLSAVVAVSTTDVWAVGSIGVDGAVAEHWDGSSWHQFAMPTPRGASEIELYGAAADSSTDVWVVGTWAGSGGVGYRSLIERWDGTGWKLVRSPNPTVGNVLLHGVAVLSPTDAWAVGSLEIPRYPDFPDRTLVLHWDGKSWKRVPSPSPTDTGGRHEDELRGVSAVSPRNVWAVGTYFHRGDGHPVRRRHSYATLVLHWNGKVWTQVPSPNPSGIGRLNTLDSVAARSARDVWAMGAYAGRTGGYRLLAEHWQGNSWQTVRMPLPPTPAQDVPELTSIAPLSAGDVWASGSYLDGDFLVAQPLVAHWNGSAWTLVPTPKVGIDSWLPGIAAVSANDVWAVGAWDSCE